MGNNDICLFGFVEDWYYLPDWVAANIIIHYPFLKEGMCSKRVKILYWAEYIDGVFKSKGFKVLRSNNALQNL